MDLFEDVDELKVLLDKLVLKTLELVEGDLTLKISIEKLTNEGTLNMAKTRFIQGSNSVSISQLPTDDDREFKALKTLSRTESDELCSQFSLETHEVDKEQNYIDPSNWFGILVPQTLRAAREKYEKAIELSVESANVRNCIVKNCDLIQKLKAVKLEFEKSEE